MPVVPVVPDLPCVVLSIRESNACSARDVWLPMPLVPVVPVLPYVVLSTPESNPRWERDVSLPIPVPVTPVPVPVPVVLVPAAVDDVAEVPVVPVIPDRDESFKPEEAVLMPWPVCSPLRAMLSGSPSNRSTRSAIPVKDPPWFLNSARLTAGSADAE